MKKFSIYETITASILAASVVMAGCTMAGQGSAFNRASVNAPAEPLMITIGSVDIVTLTPTPTEAILLKESPIEMLGNDMLERIDINDLISDDEEDEIVPEIAEEETEATEATEATDETIATADEITDETVAATEAGEQQTESDQQAVEETSAPAGSETTVTTTVEVVETEPEPEPEPEPSYSINYPPAGTEEYELFILVNEARTANGLAPLSWSGGLADASYVRAGEAVDCFSHTRPDGSDWWTVNPDIMYGENLAQGQTNAQWVFDDWMNSPSHRENIMNPGYVTYGSARVGDTWAQEFGY